MTNPKRGECEVTLAGTTYQAKLNLDSIMRIETATQRGFLKLATELSSADFKMEHIVFVLQTALKGGGNDIKDAKMKQIIWEAGITEAVTAVGMLVSNVITGNEDVSGNDQGVESE